MEANTAEVEPDEAADRTEQFLRTVKLGGVAVRFLQFCRRQTFLFVADREIENFLGSDEEQCLPKGAAERLRALSRAVSCIYTHSLDPETQPDMFRLSVLLEMLDVNADRAAGLARAKAEYRRLAAESDSR